MAAFSVCYNSGIATKWDCSIAIKMLGEQQFTGYEKTFFLPFFFFFYNYDDKHSFRLRIIVSSDLLCTCSLKYSVE